MELRPIDVYCRVYYVNIRLYNANSLYTCLQSIDSEPYFLYVGIL